MAETVPTTREGLFVSDHTGDDVRAYAEFTIPTSQVLS